MFKDVISWLKVLFSKEICTSDQLSRACNTVIIMCNNDMDGKITVREAMFMILKFIKSWRSGDDN